jgi:hypothetical protein
MQTPQRFPISQPENERKKRRVPIPHLPKTGLVQYLYPQPLMHIRLSIFFKSPAGKQKKAADRAGLQNWNPILPAASHVMSG